MAGQIVVFETLKGQILWDVFYERNKRNKQNFGFVGQIKTYRGPHLARELYVVHACSKVKKILHVPLKQK
jgi:hypothetical protein